jgi:hypothetical protein
MLLYGHWIQWLFCDQPLTAGHYRMYIISSVGHSRSDSIGLLVLWTVAYGIRDTNIVSHVPRDNVNLAEITSWVRHTIELSLFLIL